MAKRTKDKPDDQAPPLDEDEQLFQDMESLLARITARINVEAELVYKASPGVPLVSCHQMLMNRGVCRCSVVGKIIEAKEQAERLRQQQEASAA